MYIYLVMLNKDQLNLNLRSIVTEIINIKQQQQDLFHNSPYKLYKLLWLYHTTKWLITFAIKTQ